MGGADPRRSSSMTRNREEIISLLALLPVLSYEDNNLLPYDVDRLMVDVRRAEARSVIRAGFDHESLYSDELIDALSEDDFKNFEAIKGLYG